MSHLREILYREGESDYADFLAKSVPTVDRSRIIGVRVPKLRKIAKQLQNSEESESFLSALPHDTYDENLLHAILLGSVKNTEACYSALNDFLPYVDNWAVCDTLRPKSFVKAPKDELMKHILSWIRDSREYVCRFGLDMLMTYFTDSEFDASQLELAVSVAAQRDEYYVKMMVAWYIATALAKQWEATVPVIEEHRLPEWIHRKAIQKACESFRIPAEQKTYLKSFR